MDMSEEGYTTGGKDGVVRLWDTDFKPITSINLVTAKDGYKGIKFSVLFFKYEGNERQMM